MSNMGFQFGDKTVFKSKDKEAVYKYAREHGCSIKIREFKKNTPESYYMYYAVE